MSFRRLIIFATALAGAGAAGAPAAHATSPLDFPDVTAVWTVGSPNRIVFQWGPSVTATPGTWYAYEQSGATGRWVDTGIHTPTGRIEPPSAVVVRPSPNTWEVHVFYQRSTSVGILVGESVRRSGGWLDAGTLPTLPAGVEVLDGPTAVSNVYNTGLTLEPQSSVSQIAVYVIGTNQHLYGCSRGGSTDLNWKDLGSSPRPLSSQPDRGRLMATAAFNNGAFSTSVWVNARGWVVENSGPFDSATRSWNAPAGANSGISETTGRPAAVTWYDNGSSRDPSHAHTRVALEGLIGAFFREPNGTSGWDDLNMTAWPVSASVDLAACGQGCPLPPPKVRLLTMGSNNNKELLYLDKDNSNTSPSFVDQWTALPRPPETSFSSFYRFTRLASGSGLGSIYAINEPYQLYEYIPSTNRWVNYLGPNTAPMLVLPGITGNVEVFSLHTGMTPVRQNWLDRNSGIWQPGFFQSFGNARYTAMAGAAGTVFGINDSNSAAVVASQGSNGGWLPDGSTLPGGSGPSLDNPKALVVWQHPGGRQVFGLGRSTGTVYSIAKQTNGGQWQATSFTTVSSPSVTLRTIMMATGTNNVPRILGLGVDGKAYEAAFYNGQWRAGSVLPGQTQKLASIATLRTRSNKLQVIGLSEGGYAYLIGTDQGGTWTSGSVLPGQTGPMNSLAAEPNGEVGLVVGLGARDGLPYLVSWQDRNDGWNAGFQLPAPTGLTFANLTLVSSGGTLHVLAVDAEGMGVYEPSMQYSDGNWSAGSHLPTQ